MHSASERRTYRIYISQWKKYTNISWLYCSDFIWEKKNSWRCTASKHQASAVSHQAHCVCSRRIAHTASNAICKRNRASMPRRNWVYASAIYSPRAMKQKKPIVIIEKNTAKRVKAIMALAKKQKGQTLIIVPEVAMLNDYLGLGTTQILIGTQKSLFLSFENLTTIVLDEEQYESHKSWNQYPRLHTGRGARELAALTGAQLVYASSYPSLALRYMIESKACEIKIHNPIEIQPETIPFSFEDRKWKRALPNDAGTRIRAWARGGKKVLVLYNKKDNQKIQEALFFRLSKKAKENISLGTASLLTDAMHAAYDRVVWISPELTIRAIDYRSSERARILAARLQNITPKHPITVVTRSAELTQRILGVSDSLWYEHVLKERRMLNLPPFTDLVRLTIRDKSSTEAYARAETVRTMLQDAFAKIPNTRAFGPYQEKGPKKSRLVEWHILISGQLAAVAEA